MRRRRFLLLLLDRDRVRFLGMSLAGLLLIGLTASAERGAAVMGLAYVLGAPQPAAISSPAPVNVIEVSAPSSTPEPSATPSPTASPRAGGIPAPRTPSPSPAGVTQPPSGPVVPPPTVPPPTAPPATTPPPSTRPPSAPPVVLPPPTSAPASASPTPSASPAPTASPLAIAVTTGATPHLFQVSAIVPGDTWTRDATVTNPGGVSFRYAFELTQSASSLLWSDPDGLHVQVSSGATVLYDGLASAMGQVSMPNTVAPGASDVLHFVFSLPIAADNRFQGLTQELQIVFTATQTP